MLQAGEKFGRWTVVERAPNGHNWDVRMLCECACGNRRIVAARTLKHGKSRSCGCLRDEVARRLCSDRTKHGLTNTKEHRAWSDMKRRCYGRVDDETAAIYQARGIQVALEWQSDFVAFLSHIGPAPSKAHSIDRINTNGNYEPGNVRWATWTEQANNRRPRRRNSGG